MDYTNSPNYVTHAGTGQRMHEASQALPTVVSDQDMNMVLWSLMEVVKDSGLSGIQFSKDSPTSYQRLRDALRALYTPKIEYSSVPASNKGLMIVVTQPHLRVMTWNGTQYVRAPWHQPCQLFLSYDNPATIPGALPVRADVSYQQSNYPDVVQRLGLSGSGTFTLVEARGEFVRVLDNGRGVDVGRANQSAQAASRWGLISHIDGTCPSGWHDKLNEMYLSWEDRMQTINTGGSPGNFGGLSGIENTYPHLWREGALRPRNVAFPLWMTI